MARRVGLVALGRSTFDLEVAGATASAVRATLAAVSDLTVVDAGGLAVAVASSREDLASSVSHLPHVAPRVAPRVASSRHESHRVNAMEIQRRRRRS